MNQNNKVKMTNLIEGIFQDLTELLEYDMNLFVTVRLERIQGKSNDLSKFIYQLPDPPMTYEQAKEAAFEFAKQYRMVTVATYSSKIEVQERADSFGMGRTLETFNFEPPLKDE